MSKYTTQIRYICERAAGFNHSVDFGDDYETAVEAGAEYLFDFPIDGSQGNLNLLVKKQFVRHYYTREIGFETVGLFRQKLQSQLLDILPYYDYLWTQARNSIQGELWFLSPTKKRDITDTTINTGTQANTGTDSQNVTAEDETRNTKNGQRNVSSLKHDINPERKHVESDTPQGNIANIQNSGYASFVSWDERQDNTYTDSTTETFTNFLDAIERETTTATTANHSNTRTDNLTTAKTYSEIVTGVDNPKINELLTEYKNTLFNINFAFINEFENLFLQIW